MDKGLCIHLLSLSVCCWVFFPQMLWISLRNGSRTLQTPCLERVKGVQQVLLALPLSCCSAFITRPIYGCWTGTVAWTPSLRLVCGVYIPDPDPSSTSLQTAICHWQYIVISNIRRKRHLFCLYDSWIFLLGIYEIMWCFGVVFLFTK